VEASVSGMRSLLAILAMTVTNSEEMAVFEAAEVWHRDPNVLIYLLGI